MDFLGNSPSDFEWRPGERVAIGDRDAREEARLFREVLGRYASGVTVVTTTEDGRPAGLTCQSFTSVSLDPPLVAFLPTRRSRSFAVIRRTGVFCVNFLAAGQDDISDRFAASDDDRFTSVDWSPSPGTGSPLLAGIVGHVDCSVESVDRAGDHYVVIGRVVDLAAGAADEPLLYYRGAYRGGAPRHP